MRRFLPLAFTLGFGVCVLAACSSDAVGVDGCRKIEEARCNRAAACGIDLTKPPHEGTGETADREACVRFYRDACLHGMPADPGPRETELCVSAIQTGSCDVVLKPEAYKECAFLNITPDAGTVSATPTDAASSDASTDGG
jgi:hypothetical protein